MTQLDVIKKDIHNLTTGMELIGYLDGVEANALIWCKRNAPDDIYPSESGTKVSICGMAAYLDSEVKHD